MSSSFIPIEFQKIREKTLAPFIRLHAAFTDAPTSVIASKLFGTPVFVDNDDYPSAQNGDAMALLVQINFAELPKNDTDLPNEGILQIFLPTDDDLYGADFEHPEASNADFAVRFLPVAPQTEHVASADILPEDALFPVYGEHALTFSLDEGFAGLTSIECQLTANKHPFELLEDVSLDDHEESQFYDSVEANAKSQGHKLLGYPYFTQMDPRENTNYRLLLQIDTDMIDDNDIMWGDNGVAQFFIRDEDLKKRDFSKLWFNWDCF